MCLVYHVIVSVNSTSRPCVPTSKFTILWLGGRGLLDNQMHVVEMCVHHEARCFIATSFQNLKVWRHIRSTVNEILPVDRFVGIVLIPPCLSEQLCFVGRGESPTWFLSPFIEHKSMLTVQLESPAGLQVHVHKTVPMERGTKPLETFLNIFLR